LKNNGYYAFSKDFLSLKINALDTAKTGKLQVITYIPSPDRNPRSNNYSTAYNIGNIQFIADGTYTNAYRTTVDTVYSPNIQYIFVNKKFSPSVLDTKIDLRKIKYLVKKNQPNPKEIIRFGAVPIYTYQFGHNQRGDQRLDLCQTFR
jgi:hypothetical protein